MTPKTGFTIANRISILAAVLALAFLFTYPHRYLESITVPLRDDADIAQAAALQEDMDTAQAAASRMQDRFYPAEERLKLFLDHGYITELSTCIGAVRDLAELKDAGQMLEQVHSLKRQIDTIEECENFSIYNLF